MLNLEIDGKAVQVRNGGTVMDAANKLGVYIPYFCYHKKLSIAANCRMCLVQVEKAPKPLPACATPATEGMKVWTHSDQAIQAQKSVMEFLLINHPLDCPICDQGGECQLQDLAVGYGGSSSRYRGAKRVLPLDNAAINECWLSDKDRFSYEALNSEERLTAPMIKRGGEWKAVDWQTALEYVASGLSDVVAKHGANAVGTLVSPHSTLEELALAARFMRALGSDNIDFRLRQIDFRDAGKRAGIPWLGMPIADLN